MATPANAVSSRKLKMEDILDLRAYERIRAEIEVKVSMV